MIDPSLLRGDPEAVATNLARRGFELDIETFNAIDSELRELRQEEESLRAQRNKISKEIGELYQQGKKEEAEKLQNQASLVGDDVSKVHTTVSELQERCNDFLLRLPNLLDAEVPDGKNDNDNVELRKVGEPPQLDFEPRDHVELGELLGLLDFEAASTMAQARFVVLRGDFARLHRALAQFMLEMHVKDHGYAEHYVPYLVSTQALVNSAQLPKFGTDDEFFTAKADDLHLIPTAEVSLANLCAGRTFKPAELPFKVVAHSPCFRREAGSYGKDTRGMLRQHQFDKVELVQAVAPERSAAALEEMVSHAEAVLKELELPYRVMALCSGDIGNASARTYDLEVWLPGQQAYREISSCSNVRDYQARRMAARLRLPDKSSEFVHMLNGSGVAVGRALIAVLENYQQEDGSIRVPAALQRYFDQDEIAPLG